jgi:hypothetical protein
MRSRPLSLRAFDAAGMMVDADLVDGKDGEALIRSMLENPAVAHIQATTPNAAAMQPASSAPELTPRGDPR